MKRRNWLRAISIALAGAAAAGPIAALAQPGASANAPQQRWTFDGNIRNNSLAISPDEGTAVVSYSERPEVLVYDLKSGTLRSRLSGFVTPRNIVFEPSGKSFYISDSSLGTISQFDTASLEKRAAMPAGPGAFGTAMSKDGSTLYVNNQAANTVSRFDLKSGQPHAVIAGFAQPRQGVRLSPDGSKLYVTNFLGDKITVVDTATSKIEGEITGFKKLRAISVMPDGKTIFAANSGSDTIAVVDVEKRVIASTIAVGKEPYGAALTPDARQVYVGNLGDNTVSVIDVASRKVLVNITGFDEPRQAIVFSADAKTAYVLNKDLSIAKVDMVKHRVESTIGAAPKS